MTKPLEIARVTSTGAPLPEDERIDDYLEHLGAPLVGIVPYPERKALQREARAHLDGLIDEYVWQGKERGAALETALQEFGEPWTMGQAFLQEWLLGSVHRQPKILMRNASVTAFACFGLISLIIALLLDHGFFVGRMDDTLWITIPVSVIGPLAAGTLTGALVPKQAEAGVKNAVLILALHTFALGLLLLPRWEAVALSAWQIIFWLPAGRVCAGITANHLRQFRRRRFWHVARS